MSPLSRAPVLLGGLALCAAVMTAQAPAASAATASPTCAQMAAAEPQASHTKPPAAPALFAPDFPRLYDCEWDDPSGTRYPLGGFGGLRRGAPLKHTPVIFVHGNQADAENWFLVADQFAQQAGYTAQEMYALSYNGLENGYAGLPTCCAPSARSQSYWQQTGLYEFCCNGGHGASDDPNVADLYAFVRAVQAYTGSPQVDIVAHSLGVTITRKMLLLHPDLRPDVLAAVMIAGANHGTTVCRGLESAYYGCDEIAPGSPWLDALNSGLGEAPGPTRWLSIYNGTDNADPFFQAYTAGGQGFDDHASPHLAGAENLTCAQTYHNDLRVRPDIVQTYLRFLLTDGQASGSQAPDLPAIAPPAGSPGCIAAPPTEIAEAPLVPLLPAGAAVAVAALLRGRRRRSGGLAAAWDPDVHGGALAGH